MYSKLSIRNVKRSFKDYFIYFLTLTFAVCIFYSFNSLEASEAMTTLNASQSEMLKSLMQLLSYVSIFVSVVLAFLILYANNFLVRRRKKELGLYMLLGMSKYRISQILVVETFLVGLVSLVAGILLGIVLSQGLATLTISMFDANITQFSFVFSSKAMMKTLLYFGLIFVFVMVFNSVVMSRYKLIDLLTAARKNQSLKIRKTSTSVILFIISISLLATSYKVIMKYGLFSENSSILWICIGLGALGTLLFFMSLSGFLLKLLQQNKKIYFKDVNMFVFRQINSKVNTTFISMTIICLMLFFTIGVFSTGFSYKASMEKNVEKFTPFDASFSLNIDESKMNSVHEIAQVLNVDLEEFGENHSFYLYSSDVKIKTLLTPYQDEETKPFISNSGDSKLRLMKESDYKKMLSMQGVKPIHMNNDEIVLLSNFSMYKNVFDRLLKDRKTLTINGKKYAIAEGEIYELAYKTEFYSEEIVTVVVPDEVVNNQKPVFSVVNINYDGNHAAHDEELYKLSEKVLGKEFTQDQQVGIVTKTLIQDTSVGSSTMIVFVGIYLGIVFLISSAAVLALQQLSEASDNLDRYYVLKKIGVTKKNINKAIFWQLFIYFMMPLALAIIHSIFGIQVVNKAIMVAGEASVLFPSIITALIMIIVYGGYFLATYTGYKSIVK